IFFLLLTRRLPRSTLFPYTTLFRSGFSTSDKSFAQFDSLLIHWIAIFFMLAGAFPFVLFVRLLVNRKLIVFNDTQVRGLLWIVRSEEHTSELQSRENLVCRLLLEKK